MNIVLTLALVTSCLSRWLVGKSIVNVWQWVKLVVSVVYPVVSRGRVLLLITFRVAHSGVVRWLPLLVSCICVIRLGAKLQRGDSTMVASLTLCKGPLTACSSVTVATTLWAQRTLLSPLVIIGTLYCTSLLPHIRTRAWPCTRT